MSKKLLRPILFVLLFLLALQFFGNNRENEQDQDDIAFLGKERFSIGREVELEIKNNTETPIALVNECPKNPLTVEENNNGKWSTLEASIPEEKCPDAGDTLIEPGKSQTINYAPWNYKLFDSTGRYRVLLNTQIDGEDKTFSKEIEIKDPSWITKIWNEALYKPILNILVFFVSLVPGHSLGWGIILLTLLIKLILLIPNHKALLAQKKMQKVQPELEALKKKYKDQPQKLAEETMKIWQKYKVNPLSSCLPILIQLPILIALFYVVKDGLSFINPQMLYASLQGFDLNTIDPTFLGAINLTEINPIILPIIVGLLQFTQMQLSIGKNMAKTEKSAENPLPMMNKTMVYVMPIMIAVFTATLPAAVGFYWGTSTLFAILQQIVINRTKD
jgi:YidC/Oxa1 family membrane protein insertase